MQQLTKAILRLAEPMWPNFTSLLTCDHALPRWSQVTPLSDLYLVLLTTSEYKFSDISKYHNK